MLLPNPASEPRRTAPRPAGSATGLPGSRPDGLTLQEGSKAPQGPKVRGKEGRASLQQAVGRRGSTS